MAVSNLTTSALVDHRLPEVAVLLAGGIPEPLSMAASELGGRLTKATAVQVTWWPGQSITVRYRVMIEGGSLPGEHQLVAVAGDVPSGTLIVEGSGGARIGLWRVPFDPQLPGLASALDPGTAGALLDDLGVAAGKVRTRLRAYRPRKRAVVEVSATGGTIFLKLVPTDEVARLHQVHRRLASHLPIPQSLGYSPELGLMALAALAGTTLRDRLVGRGPLPSPGALETLLEALPEPERGWKAPSSLSRVARQGELLSALLPQDRGFIENLVAEIGPETEEPNGAIHGDFYEAQVMVTRDRVSGLLDFDTFGWGRRADDSATLLGHLAVLTESHDSLRLRRFAGETLARADARFDPVSIRRRAAAVILSLAGGPFRVQRPNWPQATLARLGLAARWMESSRRVQQGKALTLDQG